MCGCGSAGLAPVEAPSAGSSAAPGRAEGCWKPCSGGNKVCGQTGCAEEGKNMDLFLKRHPSECRKQNTCTKLGEGGLQKVVWGKRKTRGLS